MYRNLFPLVCFIVGSCLVGCGQSNEVTRPDMTPPDKKPELQMSSPVGGDAGAGGGDMRGAPTKGE